MISQIQFSHSTSYLLLCLLVGLIYAMILYWRENKFTNLSKAWRYLLFVIRMLTAFLISALLLNPFIKTVKEEIKKPLIVYAQDHSKSIALAEPDLTGFFDDRNQVLTELSEDYDLINLRFGSEIEISEVDSFPDKSTNLSALISHVSENYGDQNLGAVIIATDGLYNEGINPIYQNAALKAPIYSIALGDSTVRKDVLIKNVFHNKIAYLGDKVDIQADIQGISATGQNLKVSLSEIVDGKAVEIDSKNIRVDKGDYFSTSSFEIEAKKAGTVQYRINVTGIAGEISKRNNSKDIYIEVLDSRQDLLLLAHAPHPDITALKHIIEKNKNYVLDIKYADEPGISARDYDMYILHSLPSRDYPLSSFFSALKQNRKPSLFITGSKTDVPGFNKIQDVLEIKSTANALNESQVYFGSDFSSFIISDQSREFLKKVPPLTTFFGEHNAGPNAKTILNQRIKDIETKEALMLIQDQANIKTGVIAGEGIWRWRLYDYLQHKNHELADEIFIKLIQYLGTKEDKRKFRTFVGKNIFKENESIRIDGQVYNDNYELVNEPEVTAVIRKGSKEFNYTFSRTQQAYKLDVGRMPPGRYSYQAKTNSGGNVLTSEGQFTVQNIELEQYDLTAKHGLLYALADRTGGSVFDKSDFAAISTSIRENQNIKPVAYYSNQTRNIIHYKWIWGILIFLLALEWFLRRYWGSY